MSPRLSLTLLCLILVVRLFGQPSTPNNTLRGRVLYQSSGSKPAIGAQIKEKDSNGDYSKNNGEYRLVFQSKRNGAALQIELAADMPAGKKIELVNEKEVKAAKLPASADEVLDIIVCPAGQRDIAAQKYYRILRTTADRELEKKKKEVEGLLAQKEKDYQKISNLFAQLDAMQAALDSVKIREQAFGIASINLDRASKMVQNAVKKIEVENDVEGALKILSVDALDTAYQVASALKKKADREIRQVIEGYEFKISLLEPMFKFGQIAECYERIAGIYDKEGYDKEKEAVSFSWAANYWGQNGEYQKQLEGNLKALHIFEKVLPSVDRILAGAYNDLAISYGNLGNYSKQLEINMKSLAIREKIIPVNDLDLVMSYNNLSHTFLSLGEIQKSMEYNLLALTIQERTLPVNHPEFVTSYSNLSGAYYLSGEYQKALEWCQKALTIDERTLSLDDPRLAKDYQNLGAIYLSLGLYEKAEEFNLKCLAILEKVLPLGHPQLGSLYNNISLTYLNSGDHKKSLEYGLKTLINLEKSMAPNHPDLARTYNNLGVSYLYISEYQLSIKYNLKALGIWEKVLPPEHSNLSTLYNNLAAAYGKIENREKQLEFNLKSLNNEEKAMPKNYSTLAISYNNIGCAYRDIGEHKKSIEYAQKAIHIGEDLNPVHRFLNRFYYNLAISYVKIHQYPEAKTFLKKSERLKPEAGVYKGWIMYYALQKKKKQAIEHLQKAVTLGFKDLNWLETEPDLKNIRKEKGYKDLVEQLKKQ